MYLCIGISVNDTPARENQIIDLPRVVTQVVMGFENGAQELHLE